MAFPCAKQHQRAEGGNHLLAKILREYEEAGEAMRHFESAAQGRIAWKATPSMLTRLADAEQDAREDLEHDLT